ncbi:UNVERIFIED_CONTAM: hypothetical protein FKN15_017615 [Acipenser sinensis]
MEGRAMEYYTVPKVEPDQELPQLPFSPCCDGGTSSDSDSSNSFAVADMDLDVIEEYLNEQRSASAHLAEVQPEPGDRCWNEEETRIIGKRGTFQNAAGNALRSHNRHAVTESHFMCTVTMSSLSPCIYSTRRSSRLETHSFLT